MSVTVFLATFNRTTTLERTLASFRALNDPYEIVLVDNGTDWTDARDLLDQIWGDEDVPAKHPLGKVDTMDALTANFNKAIALYHEWDVPTDWYAVTDADICFEGTHPDALTVYQELAEATGHAVGPHLRADKNIPHGYPLRSRLLATETRLLYRDTMTVREGVPYSTHPIDTTFHLFPAAPQFKRLGMNTLRVGPPYDAMHLDWYVDFFNPTAENEVYLGQGGTGIGSWGRNWLAGYWRAFRRSPEEGYAALMGAKRNGDDLCNASFMISWALQFGVGVEQDIEESQRWLRAAIPKRYDIFWEHEEDWMNMIYHDDFSGLGW